MSIQALWSRKDEQDLVGTLRYLLSKYITWWCKNIPRPLLLWFAIPYQRALIWMRTDLLICAITSTRNWRPKESSNGNWAKDRGGLAGIIRALIESSNSARSTEPPCSRVSQWGNLISFLPGNPSFHNSTLRSAHLSQICSWEREWSRHSLVYLANDLRGEIRTVRTNWKVYLEE